MIDIKQQEIRNAFSIQKSKAKVKKTAWNLTLEEWVSVWLKSGKYEKKGKLANQFVLARIDKTIGFEINNVHIVTKKENGKNKSQEEIKASSERGKKLQETKKLNGEFGTYVTPLGQYHSLRDAADAHGVHHETINKRMKSSNNPEYYKIGVDNEVDKKEKKRPYSARKNSSVITDKGKFKTAADAARAHECSPQTMGRWLKSGKKGFYYEGE